MQSQTVNKRLISMYIEQKKRKEEDFFKSFYPVADDKVRKKTNAELELKTYKLHF